MTPGPGASATESPAPQVLGLNAFYYYRDVEAAWAFYADVLGLETVADYGFAKILRVADASYLTLVDAEQGMHSADEPKSVTLAIVTEEVEEWWAYLSERGVEMRSDFNYREGQAHDGFLAIDPGARGLHQATEEKGVTLSFFTSDVDGWFDRVRAQGLQLRAPEVTDESGRVRVFVAYDREGYFLEWDTFLDVPDNQALLAALGGG